MANKPASLSGLTVPKGSAAPVPSEEDVKTQFAPDATETVTAEKSLYHMPPKAVSVKMDHDRYKKLRTESIESGRTHQEIMVAAFDALMSIPPRERYKARKSGK